VSLEAREPLSVFVRLVGALLLGGIVAQIYQRTRAEHASSFTTTLVLLAILIAMVTQVIGDNVARAFSLVGALSIVRFRTVVRDTEDTAYVIFAVAVGMAVGAQHVWVAVVGIVVIWAAAMAMRRPPESLMALPFRLRIRLGLGHRPDVLLGPTLDTFVRARRLVEVSTVQRGSATEVSYLAALRDDGSGHELVVALNRLEGVQGASVERADLAADE
jgi:hypothetical protein